MSDINELIGNEDWDGALAALGATVEACEYPNGAADAIYEAFTAVPNDNAGSEAFVLGAVGLLCAKQNAYGETMAANWKDNYFTIFEPLEKTQPYSIAPCFVLLVEELVKTGTAEEEWEKESIVAEVKRRLGDDHALVADVEAWVGEPLWNRPQG